MDLCLWLVLLLGSQAYVRAAKKNGKSRVVVVGGPMTTRPLPFPSWEVSVRRHPSGRNHLKCADPIHVSLLQYVSLSFFCFPVTFLCVCLSLPVAALFTLPLFPPSRPASPLPFFSDPFVVPLALSFALSPSSSPKSYHLLSLLLYTINQPSNIGLESHFFFFVEFLLLLD